MIPSFSGDLWIPLVFIILVALIFSGRLGNKDRKDTENTERLEKTKAKEHTEATPASKDNHGASHGNSGGHGDGGHGHGGGILSTLATIAFVAVCGFGIYLFAQELQSIPPKTQHPIRVATAGPNSVLLSEGTPPASESSQVRYDPNPANYCQDGIPQKTSESDVVENPVREGWTTVDIPEHHRICVDTGTVPVAITAQECRAEKGTWESCEQNKRFRHYRFKATAVVTTWTEMRTL